MKIALIFVFFILNASASRYTRLMNPPRPDAANRDSKVFNDMESIFAVLPLRSLRSLARSALHSAIDFAFTRRPAEAGLGFGTPLFPWYGKNVSMVWKTFSLPTA